MTDREKAIVMAYTGVCMLTGDKLSVFYEYVEGIMGRPVYTHEMGTKVVDDLIKEKARPDFMALCADEGSSEKPNKWIPVSERLPEIHNYMQEYIVTIKGNSIRTAFFTETNGKSWWSIDDVIAWMPLPLPYKASPTGEEVE